MKRAIPDMGEVSVDFPDKVYIGHFNRHSDFEASAKDDGLMLKMATHGGEKREAQIHLHHYLLADVLTEWAASLKEQPKMSPDHKETLLDALKAAEKAVRSR